MKTELDQLVGNYYCKLHEKTFISQNDKTIHFWKANHDEVPQLIGDPFSLKIKNDKVKINNFKNLTRIENSKK